MRRLLRLALGIGWVMAAGCSEQSPLGHSTDLAVIRAYLYAGEPVTDIQITSTLPLGNEDRVPPPINDADVWLLKEGQQYDLQPSAGDSGYYHYEDDDLSVEAGDIFEIHVACFGKVASGKTVVPPPPDSVAISADTLFISEDSFFFFRRTDSAIDPLQVTWAEEPSSLFYVTLENVEDEPEPIVMNGFSFTERPGRFVSPPRSTDEYQVQRAGLTHYGRHLVKVYHVNQEYADLYQSRQQDSRDLNEPLTNIENGLGVFSAFNSDSVYFHVLPE